MLSSSSRPGRVSEVIARRIKKQISDGRLAVGHKLPAERDMARQFKTSRVSVREAYRSLEEVGLLSIRRGAEGGAFVAQFDHEPVRRSLSLVLGLGKSSHEEVTEARVLLEPPIARLAALRARPEDVAKLEQVLMQEEQEVRHSSADSGTTAGQFHRAIAACARNMPLVVLMNALGDLTAESVSTLDARTRSRHRRKNCEYHRQIFEAIRAHDGEAAYTLMLQHVGDIQDRVSRTMKKAGRNGICGPSAAPRRANGRRR
ncbi:MAG TPA: FadR/GntR family transcriptional regulator [Vicinamibacterales bacterium]|jgi:GntR family transcriptional regulator, transcriptional repressor for pyruvate dehydrogenase complex|nr:FadR/GntR family transcriptional regulator [Vicinamibacterales bacterium]